MPLLGKLDKESKSTDHYKSVFVYLLDNNQTPFEIDLKDDITGSILLDRVCLLLGGILERDYFGLRYVFRGEEKRWLDAGGNVYRQIKKAKTRTLSLRVRHYPANLMSNVVQDLVRYFFYLQLRRDLFSGNLLANGETLSKLIALVIQAEHGDLIAPSPSDILSLVSDLSVVENVNDVSAEEVCQMIVTLDGLDCKEAEKQFLIIVSRLESYGVEPYCVADQTGSELFLGMNHLGICTFVAKKRKHVFYWENISKMMFVKKTFMFNLNIDDKKRRLGFKFRSEELAKEFWKWALDRQSFMTLNRSSDAKQMRSNDSIFSRKLTHKFSGRSLRELMTSCTTLDSIPQPPILRTRNPTMVRSNSFKDTSQHSMNLDHNGPKPNKYSTMSKLQFVNSNTRYAQKHDLAASNISPECKDNDNEAELPIITENAISDQVVEPVMESEESKMVQSLFANFDEMIENENDSQLHERRGEQIRPTNDPIVSVESRDNHVITNVHTLDGMFFIKFVIVTSLILLVIVSTSLTAYYYYRSSSIAGLHTQKQYSQWKGNVDLESIKKFIMRSDDA